MDVSIAVSLIRGQMGAVVERAVNGAVETVLAEMLKVVGVKFEELKVQLALMKREVATLQREKVLKDKENDNVRAKLRYTELKLKYYRQGVEEELQHRTSNTSLVRSHQPKCPPGQTSGTSVSSTGASPSCSSQTSTAEDPPTSNRALLCHVDQDVPQRIGGEGQEADLNATAHKHLDGNETILNLPPFPTHDAGQESATPPLSPHGSPQADSSTLAVSTTQVKMEEEDQQVISIKEEPEEEQEVMSCLLMDKMMNQNLVQSEVMMSGTQWSGLQTSQNKSSSGFSSNEPSPSYATPQASFPAIAPAPPGSPRQMVRGTWTKDLSLYEEYKMRRNELRRRSLNRRRELEKTLPQPLLADLVRERREKTRLRVARWRAKRKLQACLNQAPIGGDPTTQFKTHGGAVAISQDGFAIAGPQQHKVPCASTSSPPNNVVISAITTFPFVTPPASSSLFMRGPDMSAQANQHALMSMPHTPAPYPQVSLSQQSKSLTDTNVDS
ncbi:uncharacterized protein si:ch211-67e16.4 [Corythoichthys intestinalis]|uniref:uncharacterized protein si:ch211-67e16.4 n=1 Tax=Corythoichthys intestinalis TaxID=161448 RepID=UPI0025A5682D|nr:uncharacterized protein si:ch211-67e16.4 [Corythoichthys intestinalis]